MAETVLGWIETYVKGWRIINDKYYVITSFPAKNLYKLDDDCVLLVECKKEEAENGIPIIKKNTEKIQILQWRQNRFIANCKLKTQIKENCEIKERYIYILFLVDKELFLSSARAQFRGKAMIYLIRDESGEYKVKGIEKIYSHGQY